MRRKIIFIDVDGPLAWGTWDLGPQNFNIECANSRKFQIPYPWVREDCEALQEICERTNADLVVSSDWKQFYSIRQLKDIFVSYGVYAPVIDLTTHLNLTNKMSPQPEKERALQIAQWVKVNKVSNWIAIDDMNLSKEFKYLKPRIPMWRHVQVDGDWGHGGRLRDKVEECIKILER